MITSPVGAELSPPTRGAHRAPIGRAPCRGHAALSLLSSHLLSADGPPAPSPFSVSLFRIASSPPFPFFLCPPPSSNFFPLLLARRRTAVRRLSASSARHRRRRFFCFLPDATRRTPRFVHLGSLSSGPRRADPASMAALRFRFVVLAERLNPLVPTFADFVERL